MGEDGEVGSHVAGRVAVNGGSGGGGDEEEEKEARLGDFGGWIVAGAEKGSEW